MAEISSIIRVNITAGTRSVTQAGFGVPLILSEHSEFAGRIKFYSSLSGVTDDFATTDPEYLAAQFMFTQDRRPARIAIGRIDALDADIAASLQAVKEASNDWYGLALLDRTEADVLGAAAWIEAERKIFLTATADPDALNSTGDIGDQLNTLNRKRTGVLYNGEAATEFLEGGWMARQFTTAPGSSNWAYKTISGATADDLTESEITTLKGKKMNYYQADLGGLDVTREGWMANGTYIDLVRGEDFMVSRIEENVYRAIVNNEKIPYTNQGIGIIESAIREALDLAVANGIINEDYTVSVPDAAQVSSADKAARVLRNVSFSGTLAGAINEVEIEGFVSF